MQGRAALKHYWLIVGISIATAVGLNIILFVIDIAKYSPAYQKAAQSLYSPPFIQQILYTGMVIPLVEEVIFRGGIFRLLRKWTKLGIAMTVSSLLFGIYHGNLVQFVYATLCGLLLAYLYEKYGSLKAPILAHMCMNLAACTMTEFEGLTWIFQDTVRIVGVTVICVLIVSAVFVYIQKQSKNWMLQKC